MKLSELISKAQRAKKEWGDMEVMAHVDYDEDCERCGQSETYNKSGMVCSADTFKDGSNDWIFSIDGKEE